MKYEIPSYQRKQRGLPPIPANFAPPPTEKPNTPPSLAQEHNTVPGPDSPTK